MHFRQGHLLYFVTIAEEGQITRAARRLHMAQPALSQAIAQLESELGFKLLERHPRGVTLTPAGAEFYEKARVAVASAAEALQTAQSLARAQKGTIDFGFLAAPPGLDSPEPLERFAAAHPDIDLRFRELPFPTVPTTAWLADVDVAVVHAPPPDPGIWTETLRVEPRVVLAPSRHALSKRSELTVPDVIEEEFIGFHPAVEAEWAGFWSLDDHRGRAPQRTTADQVSSPQEVLAALSVREAVTTVPASVAAVITGILTGIHAIPLCGAEHARIVIAGHRDRRNPLVETLVAFGRPTNPLEEQAPPDSGPMSAS
jgi:DNA-binding transcriptional LysR family regulator